MIIAFAMFSSCASRINSLKDAKEISPSDSTGYLSLNFENNSSWNCYAIIQDTLTKQRFQLPLRKPEQAKNTVTILGKVVSEKKVGEPVELNATVIPLKPGTYSVKQIYLTMRRDQYSGSGSQSLITIKPREMTYIGSVYADIFILLFPWRFTLVAQDKYDEDAKKFGSTGSLVAEAPLMLTA